MKQYEIFYTLENGNYVRETVLGKENLKQRTRELKATHKAVKVYTEYGFRKWVF